MNVPESIVSKVKMSLFKDCKLDSLKVLPVKESKKVLIKPTLSNTEMMKIYLNNLDTDLDKTELIEMSKDILEKVG